MTIRDRFLKIAIAVCCATTQAFADAGDLAKLEPGIRALEQGMPAQASQIFTSALQAKDVSPELRARAFFLRAKAYAALKQPALAVADIDIALWMKRLPSDIAADAMRLRTQVQKLNEGPGATLSAATVSSEALRPLKGTPPAPDYTRVARDQPSRTEAVSAQPQRADVSRNVADRKWAPISVARTDFDAATTSRSSTPVLPSETARGGVHRDVEAVSSSIATRSVTRPPPAGNSPNPSASPQHWQSRVTAVPVIETASTTSAATKQPTSSDSQDPNHSVSRTQADAPAFRAPLVSAVVHSDPISGNVGKTPAIAGGSAALSTDGASPDGASPNGKTVEQPGSTASLFGLFLQDQQSPYAAGLAKADELQQDRSERIRRHNESFRTSSQRQSPSQ